MSCTKGQPDIQMISEDAIPRPLFTGNAMNNRTLKPIITDSSTTGFQIDGECDPKIASIQGLAVGSSNSQISSVDFFASSVSISCSSDGRFSFQLKSLTDLGYTPVEGTVYVIELRGVTSGGISKPSIIRITYTTSMGGHTPTLITSGGTGSGAMINTVSNDPTNGFSAQVRISNKQNQNLPGTSSHLKQSSNPNGFSAQIGLRTSGPASN